MNIYQSLSDIDSDIATNRKKAYLKKYHSDLYLKILEIFPVTPDTSFPEILHLVKHGLDIKPKCVCGNSVTWNIGKRKYHSYCSSKCSIYTANISARSDSAKQKRINTVFEKYGVKNISHCQDIKEKLKNQRLEWWAAQRPSSDYTVEGLDWPQYDHRVTQRSNTEYNRYIDLLDPDRIRGKNYHLDHIYSKFDGFRNNVPIEIMSHWSNLILVTSDDNLRKGKSSAITLDTLYENYYQDRLYGTVMPKGATMSVPPSATKIVSQ